MSNGLGHPLRSIFDTNALVSAFLSERSTPGRAFLAALGAGVVLLSEETVTELVDVASRPKFDRYVTAGDRDRFVAALVRRAELVEVEEPVVACRDPKDDKFLSLAVAGSASVIVSGDEDMLVLHPFQGVPILTPAAFLEAAETLG